MTFAFSLTPRNWIIDFFSIYVRKMLVCSVIVGLFQLCNSGQASEKAGQTPELSPDDLRAEQLQFEQQMLRYPEVMKAIPLSSGYVPSVALKLVPPQYPDEMSKANKKGQVWFELFVESNGKVRDVNILKSTDPAFESVTIEALKHAKFKPALFQGKPVRSHALRNTIEFSFN
jgi:TonB family protein